MLKNRKKEALDAPINLKLLVTIVEREKTSLYLDTLEGFDVNLQTVIYAHGTANLALPSNLGLGDEKKAVILSVVKEYNIKEILSVYEEKLFRTKKGKGLVFTIPLNSTIGVLVYNFLANYKE